MSFTPERAREMAEEIDDTVLQQVTNRGLKPGYVRDLVLAAVTEALEEQEGKIEGLMLGATILREEVHELDRAGNVLRAALDEIERKIEMTRGCNCYACDHSRAIIARTREGVPYVPKEDEE